MRTLIAIVLTSLSLVAGCVEAPAASGAGDTSAASDVPTIDAQTIPEQDIVDADELLEDVALPDADELEDAADAGTDADACDSLGCPCEADEDCAADLCVSHPDGGRVCSELCSEACSLEGFECRTLRDGGDLVRYCVPLGDPYCAPCATDADCLATDNLCLDLIDGRFCATGCAGGEPCPEGATCTGVLVGDSTRALVCVPDAEQCADCLDGDGDERGIGPGCLGFDCDDDDEATYEGAPELCDARDNDCDELEDEGFETLGDACGTCDTGALACEELALACVGDLGDEALNACGGCAALDNPPGGPCASGCGEGVWTCSSSGETTLCLGEETNACGGCSTLAEEPGSACEGACGPGVYACVDDDPERVACDDGVILNVCGGCVALDASPGDGCGPCGLDVLACDGTDALVCSGATVGNACGGCAALAGAPGTACGPCDAVWTCDGSERVDCLGVDTDADGDGVCDPDDRCPGFDDTEDADGDDIPDGCDAECERDDECPEDELSAWTGCGGFDTFCSNDGERRRTRTAYVCSDGSCAPASTEEVEPCTRDTIGLACDDDAFGDWSSCIGVTGACDVSGTRTRAVTTYACADGACIGFEAMAEESCARETEGDVCGGGSAFSDWSACDGFSGVCDTTGTQSRTRTDFACASSSCEGVDTVETRACERDTQGLSCGDDATGVWGSCEGFATACDESGTRSREITRYACDGGLCAPEVDTETEDCARDTEGVVCDDVVVGAWGECGGYEGACGEDGTQTREVTAFFCDEGVCGASVLTEDQPCARDTDGNRCGVAEYGPWTSCLYFDSCVELGRRSREVTTYSCSAGSCSSDRVFPEFEDCTRDTDGDPCEDIETCALGFCSDGACPAPGGGGCEPGSFCCEPGFCEDEFVLCP